MAEREYYCDESIACRYGHVPIGILGVVGNVVSALVFMVEPDLRRRPFVKLLVALAIADSGYLTMEMVKEERVLQYQGWKSFTDRLRTLTA